MTSPNQISTTRLLRLVGTADCPVLVDVCLDEDFDADPRLIPGAFRHRYETIGDLFSKHEQKDVVVICQKGLKLSQGAAAMLRSNGINAAYLEGGNVAWHNAGAPRIPVSAIRPGIQLGQTAWVTGHRPKLAQIACAWLIRRFVVPQAHIWFVSPQEVSNVAERYTAVSFGVDGAIFAQPVESHPFDVMLKELGLKTAPLLRLAEIIRGAELTEDDPAPEAAGILAVMSGLFSMYNDDLKQLDAAMTPLDALYRWARDRGEESCDHSSASKVN